ncbi:MAG: hypothetical protein ACK4YP_04385 [Myxococcota bacterium]
MNADLDTLVTRLDALAWRLDRGDCPPADEMDTLAATAQALGPGLAEAERRRLVGAVAAATGALERACARLRERCVGLGTGRRAVRAYGRPR